MVTFVRRAGLAAAAALVAAVGSAAEGPRAPSPAELKEAVEVLKDAYEKDYRFTETDAKAQKALAKKLFDGAARRKTPLMQYASYDEARRLAALGGDPRLALDAVAALTTKFKGTPTELAADTFKLLGTADLTPEAAGQLVAIAGERATAALDREDYAVAATLGKLAVTAAKQSEDPDALFDARMFLVTAEQLATAAGALKAMPDDAPANETLGRYWAITRGRWSVGLKYLARGSNKELAAAAAKDLADPKTAKERAAVADAWWQFARNTKGAEHRRLIARAWEWYTAALVAGGDDALAERVKEIEKDHPDLTSQVFEGHTGAVAALALTPDGRTLLSASNDGTVRVWNVAGEFLKTLEGHTSWVGSVVVTPDGARAITAGGDNVIRVWDLKAFKEVKALEGHKIAIRGLALTADGKTLVSGGSDRTCRAWDLAAGTEIRRYGDGRASIESVAVTADGKYVLAGDDAGAVTVYDAKTGAVQSKYDKHEGTTVYTVAVTADGKYALSGARDKDVHVWEIATGNEARRLKGHTGQVYHLALSADGKYLASASYDKTLRVWDFASGKELHRFEGHNDGVQGACFAPDGRFVFSASWDKTVRKWLLPRPPGDVKKVD